MNSLYLMVTLGHFHSGTGLWVSWSAAVLVSWEDSVVSWEDSVGQLGGQCWLVGRTVLVSWEDSVG